MGLNLCVRALSAWVPGIAEKSDLVLWMRGEKVVAPDAVTLPNISFVPALQKRRMTSLSKLTTVLIHSLQDRLDPNAKIYFVSLAGETERQFQVNSMVLQDGEVMPAAFSTSVFNTPPAMASIALGLRNGYSALYPSPREFFSAVQCVFSAVLGGSRSQVLMVYADVQAPKEYQALEGACDGAWGFAVLLESSQNSPEDTLHILDFSESAVRGPQDFFLSLLERNMAPLNLMHE